jgi:2-amino-4-hydroxy-6-hydroxymethyldihydropteridine diphosphokinase
MAGVEHWIPAYVALGSNLDGPRQQVERAFEALDALPETRLVLRSSLYQSAPLGPVAQPDFVNAVAGLLTGLDPDAMLEHLQRSERRLGRTEPVVRWGPRRIDLDLLVQGDAMRSGELFTLPHPGIAARAFVLLPLAEIAPQLLVAGAGRVERLLRQLDGAGLVRLAA